MINDGRISFVYIFVAFFIVFWTVDLPTIIAQPVERKRTEGHVEEICPGTIIAQSIEGIESEEQWRVIEEHVEKACNEWDDFYNYIVNYVFEEVFEQAIGEGGFDQKQKEWKENYEYLYNNDLNKLRRHINRLESIQNRLTYLKSFIDGDIQDVNTKIDTTIEMIQAQIDLANEPLMIEGSVESEDQDTQLHYTILGEGTPILLLSGGPGFSSSYLMPVMQELSSEYKCILLDQRGTGKSKLDNYDYTKIDLKTLTNDIETLREHLGINKWVILGHSWGGRLAMAYTASGDETKDYSEYVQALVLVGSGGIDNNQEVFGKNIEVRQRGFELEATYFWNNNYHKEVNPTQAIKERLRAQLPAYLFDRGEALPIIRQDSTDYFNPILFNEMVNNSKLQRQIGDKKSKLREYSRPVLIIQGEQDPIGASTAYGIYKIFEAKPNFKVTKKTLIDLKTERVPVKILRKLESIENQEFMGYGRFLNVLKPLLEGTQTIYQSLILEHAKTHQIVFINKSGHFPWVEQRKDFFDEVTKIFKNQL